MGDAYLRTGRGGAGNLYSQKDIENAVEKNRSEDIEAQKAPAHQDPNSTAPSNTSASSAAGIYARSGRGGAGNFVATTTPAASNPNPPSSIHISTPSPSAFPPSSTSTHPAAAPSSKYSGRGGAGNFGGGGESDGARRAKAEQDQRRKEALDAGIAREIRASLAQPPRTYHLHQPGRGRRPEDDVVDV
ncbi:hypothetical protein F5Y10DRAFT_206928 [Nemania abortiva]|nr:hypothetical protein F5Y10DRAFT_206928 [Nemania abortiva]